MSIVVATTTQYNSLQDARLILAWKALMMIKEFGHKVVVVDGSPEDIRVALREQSPDVLVLDRNEGMGASRRLAIYEACELAGQDGVVVWMEPEKFPLILF